MLYGHWPGSPLIQIDDDFYLGFYLNGLSSPLAPWMKVVNTGSLYAQLKGQFDLIEKSSKAVILRDEAGLDGYLASL